MSLINYELSDEDIKSVLGSCNIVAYPRLSTVDDILTLFGRKGPVVLFFEEELTRGGVSGHWEAMKLDENSKTISFFDSYGLPPDACKKWLSSNQLKQLKEFKPQLHRLLSNASSKGYKIMYNHKRLQSMKPNVNTCGRFVCTYLLHPELDLNGFYKYLDGLKKQYRTNSYDYAVSRYIYEILGK